MALAILSPGEVTRYSACERGGRLSFLMANEKGSFTLRRAAGRLGQFASIKIQAPTLAGNLLDAGKWEIKEETAAAR